MAGEPKTIEVEPGGELDRLLDEAARAPLRLVRGGERFRLDREAGDEDIWAGYDPALALDGILQASGTWRGQIDADAFKAYIRERRRTKNRSPVRRYAAT